MERVDDRDFVLAMVDSAMRLRAPDATTCGQWVAAISALKDHIDIAARSNAVDSLPLADAVPVEESAAASCCAFLTPRRKKRPPEVITEATTVDQPASAPTGSPLHSHSDASATARMTTL